MSDDSSEKKSQTRGELVKQRIARKVKEYDGDEGAARVVDGGEAPSTSPVDEVRSLLADLDVTARSTAFQSLAVAVAQALSAAFEAEVQAARASLSLAQREKLQAMTEDLEETTSMLYNALDEKGLQLLDVSTSSSEVDGEEQEGDGEEDSSWWFALAETLETLEEEYTYVNALITGLNEGSAVRRLGEIAVRLLKGHHDQLLVEAERWMGQ